ncbi:MAG TPA: ribonuclease HII [Bacteroidales bacterium]|nr:ribonuclease HII [Bacteroidales bacterium]
MLALRFSENYVEAGCDEAGRGCLAGPMFAAAVILPADFRNELLDDSKKLTHQQREELRPIIEREALAWEVASVDNLVIDEINILRASFRAMHLAIAQLQVKPELLLIDGNRFDPYPDIPHQCIIRGDGQYMSIAAASVLAKTHRDAFMCSLHDEYPFYNWKQNKGYPTSAHREAIMIHGITPLHRRSFNMHTQLDMDF